MSSDKEDLEFCRDKIKELEGMLLEYGTNNKKLLEKEKEYQVKIDALEKDVAAHWKAHKGFLADIKVLEEEKFKLQEGLKEISFKPATELDKGTLFSVVDIETGGTFIIEYRDGNCTMVGYG